MHSVEPAAGEQPGDEAEVLNDPTFVAPSVTTIESVDADT
jgi:hypothetical protein